MYIRPFIASLCVLLALATTAYAKDHDDGTIVQDRPLDISNTYAFVNPVNGKITLGLTVNTLTVPGRDVSFAHGALYQIKIDNDGDFIEDLVYQATFSDPGPDQEFELRGPAAPVQTGSLNWPLTGAGVPTIRGPANATIVSDPATSTRVFAGRVDYPAYVDIRYMESLLDVPGAPTLSELTVARAQSGSPTPGVDFFTGFNASALMIEVSADIGNGSTTMNVWSTTSRRDPSLRVPFNTAFSQIDRQGRPFVNTMMIPPDLRDEFNRQEPRNDVGKFAPHAAAFLAAKPSTPGNVAFYLDLMRNTLLPDVLTLDTTNPNGLELIVPPGSPTIVASLNGRAPPDDVADVILFLLFDGQVLADGLPGNDCTPIDRITPCSFGGLDNGLPTVFPFLGNEHADWEPIPPRN